MNRRALNIAFLWGIIGTSVLVLETAMTQILNRAFFYMLEALPLYVTLLSMLLLCSIYFLCTFISGYIFALLLDYLYLKIGKRRIDLTRSVFISASALITMTVFVYGQWWVRNVFPQILLLLLPVLFICSVAAGIFVGFMLFRIFKGNRPYGRLCTGFLLCSLSLLLLEVLCPKAYFNLSTPKNKEDGARVILITVDTLKADHLSSFGYRAITTSNIDKLAEEGVTFKQAISPCPMTNPTHSSILTGLYPQTHGVRDTAILDSHWPTLQKIFKQNGYETAAFVSGFVLKEYLSGLDNGFDLYEDRFSFMFDGFKLIRIFERLGIFPIINFDRKAAYTNRLVIPWLEHYRNKKFFLWIHYYDPHLPYEPPAGFVKRASLTPRVDSKTQFKMQGVKEADISDKVINAMLELYDGEILYADECIGEVMAVLEEIGLKEETLIILTSDHGEGFDHDYYFSHGDRLYDSGIHVPLIFRYPKGSVLRGSKVDRQIQLIDIAPTVLSLVGFARVVEMEGKDISSLLYGKDESTNFTAYSESPRRGNPASKGPFRCVRTNEWKYIYEIETSKEELYNLKNDPLERNNIANIEKEIAAGLKKSLFKWMKSKKDIESIKKPSIDELTKKKLRSLGYLQ